MFLRTFLRLKKKLQGKYAHCIYCLFLLLGFFFVIVRHSTIRFPFIFVYFSMRHTDGMNCCMANVAIQNITFWSRIYWSNVWVNRRDEKTVQVIYGITRNKICRTRIKKDIIVCTKESIKQVICTSTRFDSCWILMTSSRKLFLFFVDVLLVFKKNKMT